MRKGRFGPYVQHGKTVANLPRGVMMEDVTLDEAVALLAEKGKQLRPRGAAGRRGRSGGAAKAAAPEAAAPPTDLLRPSARRRRRSGGQPRRRPSAPHRRRRQSARPPQRQRRPRRSPRRVPARLRRRSDPRADRARRPAGAERFQALHSGSRQDRCVCSRILRCVGRRASCRSPAGGRRNSSVARAALTTLLPACNSVAEKARKVLAEAAKNTHMRSVKPIRATPRRSKPSAPASGGRGSAGHRHCRRHRHRPGRRRDRPPANWDASAGPPPSIFMRAEPRGQPALAPGERVLARLTPSAARTVRGPHHPAADGGPQPRARRLSWRPHHPDRSPGQGGMAGAARPRRRRRGRRDRAGRTAAAPWPRPEAGPHHRAAWRDGGCPLDQPDRHPHARHSRGIPRRRPASRPRPRRRFRSAAAPTCATSHWSPSTARTRATSTTRCSPNRMPAASASSSPSPMSRITCGPARRSTMRRGRAATASISPIASCRCCRRRCPTAGAACVRTRIAAVSSPNFTSTRKAARRRTGSAAG